MRCALRPIFANAQISLTASSTPPHRGLRRGAPVAAVDNRVRRIGETDSSDHHPVRVVELELGEPLPHLDRTTAPDGSPYGSANVLVRLHGAPLGLVTVPFTGTD